MNQNDLFEKKQNEMLFYLKIDRIFAVKNKQEKRYMKSELSQKQIGQRVVTLCKAGDLSREIYNSEKEIEEKAGIRRGFK